MCLQNTLGTSVNYFPANVQYGRRIKLYSTYTHDNTMVVSTTPFT